MKGPNKSIFKLKLNETWWMDTRYSLSFNVHEQLMMVIQSSCEVNREHARICNGVLWTWLDLTEWSHSLQYKKFVYLLFPSKEITIKMPEQCCIHNLSCWNKINKLLGNIYEWRHACRVWTFLRKTVTLLWQRGEGVKLAWHQLWMAPSYFIFHVSIASSNYF